MYMFNELDRDSDKCKASRTVRCSLDHQSTLHLAQESRNTKY